MLTQIPVTRKLGGTWVGLDSNQRSRRQQIYSLPHLTALEPTHSRCLRGIGLLDRREVAINPIAPVVQLFFLLGRISADRREASGDLLPFGRDLHR